MSTAWSTLKSTVFLSFKTKETADGMGNSRRGLFTWVALLAALAVVLPVTQSVVRADVSSVPAQFAAARAAAKKISSGWSHSCVIREDGFPVCWGIDADGAINGIYGEQVIGDQTSDMGGGLTRLIPRGSGSAIQRPAMVAAGGSASCLIDADAAVRCWGKNADGNLGIGSTTSSGLGLAVPLGDRVADVSVGGDWNASMYFVCALLENGSVKCWGNNTAGQLGIGDVTAPKDKIGNAAGEVAALQPINLGTGVTASAITTGSNFACVIASGGSRPAGSVLCWGDNSASQLGIGDITSPKDKIGDSANEMGDALVAVNLGAGRSAIAISAGTRHVCVLRDNYTVICWGVDYYGTLGQNLAFGTKIGDTAGEIAGLSPVNLGLAAGETVVQLEAGLFHNCALTSNNRVKCWGMNDRGQLGIGSTTNVGTSTATMSTSTSFIDLGLSNGETVAALSIGSRFSCAMTSLNVVKCWGHNSSTGNDLRGALGIGSITSPYETVGDGAGEMGANLQAVNLAIQTPSESTGFTTTGSSGSVTYSFTAPSSTYGAITGYDYVCHQYPSGSWPSGRTTFTGTSFTLTTISGSALTNGQQYECRVRAFTSSGAGIEAYAVGMAGTPLTVTSSSHTVVVGDPVPTITGTPSVSGVSRSGETCSTAYTTSSATGTYPTTCSGGSAAGYGITYVAGVITVVNPLTVTASSPTITAGDPVPTITGTPSVGGVSRSGETCSTTYTTASSEGTYPTTCTGGTATGYQITYIAGTLTVKAVPATTTTAPAGEVSILAAPTLVTAENQKQLEAKPGEAVAVINGKVVQAETFKVDTPTADPKDLQNIAKEIVNQIESVLPKGANSGIEVMNTADGAELSGIMVNPDNPKEKLSVPVESVTLVKAGEDTAVLLTALNVTNLPAEITPSGALAVTRGGMVSATAYGLPGSETGEIVLMSTPRLLQTFTVGKNGSFKGQVKLPKDISFGRHTVVMATKNAKVSLGINLVRTRMLFRIKKVVGTGLFKNRAGVNPAGGKIKITATGRCTANNKRIKMANKPGGCYITVRQAAAGNMKAVYYRFTVRVVKKLPKKVPTKSTAKK